MGNLQGGLRLGDRRTVTPTCHIGIRYEVEREVRTTSAPLKCQKKSTTTAQTYNFQPCHRRSKVSPSNPRPPKDPPPCTGVSPRFTRTFYLFASHGLSGPHSGSHRDNLLCFRVGLGLGLGRLALATELGTLQVVQSHLQRGFPWKRGVTRDSCGKKLR